MHIRNLKVSGLLSFGPKGIDLPLTNLNVLIGPNGSGKSNLIEVLALLKAAPNNLTAPMMNFGGVREWFYKGSEQEDIVNISAEVRSLSAGRPTKKQSVPGEPFCEHRILLQKNGTEVALVAEHVRRVGNLNVGPATGRYYHFSRLSAALYDQDGLRVPLQKNSISPSESILSQIKDPEGRYPVISELQELYGSFHFFRNWQFGVLAAVRREQPTNLRNDYLAEGGENLPLVVSKIRQRAKREILENLKELYGGITDIDTPVDNGTVQLFLEEYGKRWIPASRLSDGTLRYLCLLAILLHPDPSPLVVLEEPELGLHPDIIPHVGKLIKEASKQMQIVMTTHSQVLLDAFSKSPEDVIVCSRGEEGTRCERLNAEKLGRWLEDHTLGELWNMGEIGGTRW